MGFKVCTIRNLYYDNGEHLTPWRLGGFGDFRKKKQQFSVALPTP